MSWGTRRAPTRLVSALADGESVVSVTDCVPLSDSLDVPAGDTSRTAVLTDRALYVCIGDTDVVPLPFTRMRELNRRGFALLFFRFDDSHATWELRDQRFAARAERRFAQHGLAAHKAWVGTTREAGREPAGFRHQAHLDLLNRVAGGVPFADAVADQRTLVDQLVWTETGDRASCRAALRRLGTVHKLLHSDLAVIAEAAPSLAMAQHALVLLDQPSPWQGEVAEPVDDGPTAAELAGLTPDAAPVWVDAQRETVS
ncbi:hypothetical protein [Klenkia terrae]|uniref:Uncharacterized protein n=1 Tax=Klenkia terrae TaxID=1052259 RepID=A0ABU8EC09_9ACTN|nr:hypothetical protein [Klenkia terrae]